MKKILYGMLLFLVVSLVIVKTSNTTYNENVELSKPTVIQEQQRNEIKSAPVLHKTYDSVTNEIGNLLGS